MRGESARRCNLLWLLPRAQSPAAISVTKGAVGGWGGVGEAEGGGALNQLTLTRLQTGGGEMTSITKSERISIFQIRRQLPGGTRACHVKSSTLRGLSFFPRSPPSSIVSTVGAHQMNAVS